MTLQLQTLHFQKYIIAGNHNNASVQSNVIVNGTTLYNSHRE